MLSRIKKYLPIILIFAMVLTGCGSASSSKTETTKEKTEEEITEAETTESPIDENGFTRTDDYIMTTVGKVNLRLEPSTDSKIQMELSKNVYLNRTGYNDSWSRVRLNGKDYYVYSKYVQVATIEWASDNDAIRQNHRIFLDPAKQETADDTLEPIGPGAETEKARSGTGAVGVNTGISECDVTLIACTYIKTELENRGYTVVMSRETSDVSISNSERAKAATVNECDIYVRVQAGQSENPKNKGLIGFVVTSSNPYVKRNYKKSYSLCKDIVVSVYTETGCTMQGIKETDDFASLNWCDVPATSINIGFLSNASDETNLSDKTYLKNLAKAFAIGIDNYFEIGVEE